MTPGKPSIPVLTGIAFTATTGAALLSAGALMCGRLTSYGGVLSCLPSLTLVAGHAIAIALATRVVPRTKPRAWGGGRIVPQSSCSSSHTLWD